VDGGATSAWLHDEVQAGATVTLAGPYGAFIGDPKADTPVLCLAAGSGLAPILSLAEAALRRGYSDRQPVTLLFSARTAEDVYARGLLAYWSRIYRNFKPLVTLTRETRASNGGGKGGLNGLGDGWLHGRIPDVLPGLFPDLSRHSVFIAGSPAFSDDCAAASFFNDTAATEIYTEKFTGRQPLTD
jgi:CDP-4-dehydro-6-deoxyglucose reductase